MEESEAKFDQEDAPLINSIRNSLSTQQSKLFYYSGFGNLLFLIPIAVILSDSGDECEEPIRKWLYVLLITYSITIFAAILEYVANLLSKIDACASCLLSLLLLFQVSWYIVGSVWLFADENCSDDWHDGYVLSLVLLIFFYVSCGIVLLSLVCFCCCFGIVAGVVGSNSSTTSNN